MDTKTLTQIGLTESEIKVYFALLELETSTIGPIVDKAKVQESKIYYLLERLKEKGLVSFVIKNNVKHFQAADPKNLVRIISDKEEA
jgi:sugar-specific transcriptional regulator TrmB